MSSSRLRRSASNRHLVVAISSHGFGHIGQTAPVIDALRRRVPNWKITLRTAAPRHKLIERFGSGVAIEPAEVDLGMVQQDALRVDLQASAEAYRRFHRDWEARVEAEAAALRALDADGVLANVPYLPLAAADRAGLPGVALCSLNWLDIYASFFADLPEAAAILESMFLAYSSAQCFLQPEPSMPMAGLPNLRPIGPVCQRGTNQRQWIAERTGLGDGERLVMVSLGGMDLRPPVEDWPEFAGWRLVVPASWTSRHPSTIDFEDLDLPYIDALWSCDALICKPGYGSFVEAASAGVPVLYLDRPDWPEVPYLVAWLARVGRSAHLPQDTWLRGGFGTMLSVLARQGLSGIAVGGAEQAADAIEAALS